jgi:hypothetical protein
LCLCPLSDTIILVFEFDVNQMVIEDMACLSPPLSVDSLPEKWSELGVEIAIGCGSSRGGILWSLEWRLLTHSSQVGALTALNGSALHGLRADHSALPGEARKPTTPQAGTAGA